MNQRTGSGLQKKRRANSRRGTANSKFLRARNRVQRPSGPYRPRRKPRPSRDKSVRNFWLLAVLIFMIFSFGQIWKESQVSRLCANVDSLRTRQWELDEKFVSLQLKFKEISSYPRIEPLARAQLGMHPAPDPPVVISTVDEQFLAFRRKAFEDRSR